MTSIANFSAAEVYEMAIATERSGRAFYEAVAAAAKSDSVRKMMHYLASAEQPQIDKLLQQEKAHVRLLQEFKTNRD